MQADPFQRLWWAVFCRLCVGACCLWAGALKAADTMPNSRTVKNTQDITEELERETNLQSQLARTLGPVSTAMKQTAAGARRLKKHVPAGTPEANQSRQLYTRIRQGLANLALELTNAVKTVKLEYRGETASRVNQQVIADLNDALQKFDAWLNRVVPAPPSQPPGQPSELAQQLQGNVPAGQPAPPGLSIEPIQPEQYVEAQPQPGQISAQVVVQVCNVFVVHALGLSNKSADDIRGQIIGQIRRQTSLPAFDEA
jgi:hypothetical protein